VRSKPGVNGGFDSAPRTVVWNRLKIGEVDATIGYFGTARADVFFSEAALPDAMAFLSAEGASIGALASSEERLGVVTLLS